MPEISRISEAQDPGLLSAETKRELVQRVINSQMFRRSFALRAFLLYITDQEILGRANALKEHTIGVEVLGRKRDYVPMSDNIVRVRAHELRGRLERYFASEGANEAVVITVPIGGYAPKFVARQAVPKEPAAAFNRETVPLPEATPFPETVPPVDNPERRRNLVPLTAIALITLLTSVVLVGYALRSNHRAALAEQTVAMQDFWSQFFNTPNKEMKVVYADPGYASWQDLSHKSLNLGDYLSHKYLSPDNNELLKEAVRRTASLADIEVVGRLGTLAGQFGGQVNLQFARDVSIKFFQEGNLVLLGSRRSNPWVELYEPSLNFTLAVDPQSGLPLFRNRVPQLGEAASYTIPASFNAPGGDEKQYIGYGLATLLKGCGNRGLMVLAEGLNTPGTEAVGDMLTDPERLNTLLKSIGHKAGTRVTPFEALIQITSFANTQYDDPKVVAFRLQPATSCIAN